MSTDTTPRDPESGHGLFALCSAIGMSTLLLVAGLAWAQHYHSASLEAQRQRRSHEKKLACLERGGLFVERTAEPLPLTDPHSEIWSSAEPLDVVLQRQNVAMPMLEEITIDSVRVQGLTDGERIVWRLSWRDPSADSAVDSGRFSDAVALQFPITRNATFSMGGHGQLVQILHWKALWQKDVDEHFQDVQDLHPNYWTDLYWFADGPPYTIPGSFSDSRSHAWFAAYSAGNPLADIYRALPVEELAAEGYGTLTSQQESITIGRGSWNDGEWAVVFARPMRSEDEWDYQFFRGSRGSLGVAVWDGVAGNVGGRKHWTNWIEFEVSL